MANNKAGTLTYDTRMDTSGFESGLNKVGSVAKGVAIGVGASITAIGAGLVAITKQAVDSYAEYEQLVGGIESMFGGIEKGQEQINKVMELSNNAWKDLTMSQNDYYKTFTSTYPLMKNDIEDQNEAIEQTNRLMTLESDLVNTFGYDMETATTAVNWALKGTFSYLDNLNIGIKGTQEGFLEAARNAGYMVDDVSELTSSDILDILEKTADQYGVLGKTAEEAEKTIQGSLNMTKSSWENMLNGLADDNADFDKLLEDFVYSIGIAFENLLPRIQLILENIAQLLPQILNILLENMPQLLETGRNILQTLLDGITQNIGLISDTVVQIIIGLVNFIIENLPTILEAGQNILQTLIDGIVQNIDLIVDSAMQIIMNLVDFIIQNLPTILEAGIQILFALMEGIAEALPELVPQIVNVIIKIMEIFNDNFDTFLMLGIKIIIGLIEGLVKSIPDILENLPTIIMAIINFFSLSKFLKLGSSIIKGLINGLTEGIPNILKKIPEMIGKIITTFKEKGLSGFLGVGKDILKGILNGMLDFGTIVKDTIKKLGTKILSSIKSFFGIKSPSKLMQQEVGKNIVLGIGVAFKKDDKLIDEDISNFGKEITDKMQNAVNLENGTMSFSGTSGSINQILSSNASFDGNFVVQAKVQEGVLFEANQRITKQKTLQTGFGG